MNRNDFGFWGIELSREEFSQALAVLGLLSGENIIYNSNVLEKEISKRIEQDRPLKWHLNLELINIYRENLPSDSAKVMANVWKAIADEYGEDIGETYFDLHKKLISFEVHYDYREGFSIKPGFLWLLEQLSSPEVRAASVYLYNNDEKHTVVWDFPLRIGLLADPQSRQMRADIEELKFFDQPLVGTHIKLVDIELGNADCDVLLLPHDLRSAIAALLDSPNALRADCVIVTGYINESTECLVSFAETLRTRSRATGVCLLPIPPSDVEDYRLDLRQIWFKELIRQIAHNCCIDISLFRSCRNESVNVSAPIFFASTQLIKSSLISRRIDQFREQISEKRYSLEYVSDILTDSKENFDWSHESDMATTFSNLKSEVEESLETAPPPKYKSRTIQTEIWEFSEGERKRNVINDSGLRSGTIYSLIVFIGQKTLNSLSANETFNDETLPPGKNAHELVVFFSELDISPEPKVATIVLPLKGNSTNCEFFIKIPESIAKIQGRITIAYKNRILQTALLIATVYDANAEIAESSANEKIELIVESVTRPGLQGLTERKWFDAAFVLNQDRNGESQVTAYKDEYARLISVEGISEKIKWFDDAISDVAKKWNKFGKLRSKKSEDLLRICAFNGVGLYKALVSGQNEGALNSAQRIQIVSAKYGSRLPLEFVYSHRAPDDDAPLCDHAENALREGHCDASCPSGKDEKKVICPLGFWGLSKVIERHAYDAEAIKKLSGADFALQSEPIGNRTYLHILTNALAAVSSNVDMMEKGSSQKVYDIIEKATNKQSKYVDSWDDWLADIETRSPSLLVLLPHTVKDIATGGSKLEISDNEELLFYRLGKEYVMGPNDDPRPVVILMGCETAAPGVPYESFVLEFRSLGAALVIGTGSTILGRHAATVTEAFIEAIAGAGKSGVSFGDVMLDVRRKMIADGLLMALCLTSYGDTDWVV